MSKILGLVIKIFMISLLLLLIYGLIIDKTFGADLVNRVVGMYYVHKGDKAFREYNMQEAVNAYEHGLQLFPAHYEAWLNLGNIYVAYEDYYAASQAYQNALFAKDNYTMARMNLGIITAEKLGDFDSAIQQYKQIIDSKHFLISIPFVYDNKKSETTNKAIAYYNMGRAYSQKAFYMSEEYNKEKRALLEQASIAYENAVNILPNNYDINYNLALTYHQLRDYRRAGQYYCKAIECEPLHYESHYNLGLMLKHLNQRAYSIDELEKAAVLATGKYSTHAKYIFDVLSSVSAENLEKDSETMIEDKIKLGKDNEEEQPVIFINGKIKPTDEAEVAIIENFRKCRSKNIFESNG